jgi:hypothetical protein
MPTGREGEATIGVRINRIEIGRPAPGRAREIVTDLTNRLTNLFARSDRFAPASGSLREGLDVTVSLRDIEVDTGGKQPRASCRIQASAERISGGRVAQMNEGMRFELAKGGDQERQLQEMLGDTAQDFFARFVRECDKRY